MSAPELHADDLLDREARGSLSAAERERLLAHVAVCSVCRFERQVRADFRAEFASLSAPQHAPPVTPRAAERPSLRASRPPARAPWTVALLAAALLLTGAAAAELTGVRVWSFVTELATSSRVAPSTSAAPAPRAPKRGNRKPSDAAPLVASSADEPLPSAAPSELFVSPPSMPSSSALAAGTKSKSAASAHPDAPPTELAPAESARALLGEAGAARERGDYELAVQRYRDLLRLYPGTVHAAAAHAILGRLLLDRGDPSGALPHFDAYLASGASSLAEEAQLGRALAFGQLGQAAQESSAWQALLASYPGSLHAARAKQRLAALQAR